MSNDSQLEVSSIQRLYSLGAATVKAIDDITFAIGRGDFISIMGPSGSGKTTLLNILGCIDRPTSGTVRVSGRDTSGMKPREIDDLRLRHIGFVFQRINLLPMLSARENIELPMELAGMPAAQRRKRSLELLETVGLASRASHRPTQLSGGEQQRIGIARALANSPAVILADEPTGNLDSANAKAILDLFTSLNAAGQTLVIVTHDPDVAAICTSHLNIRDGRIVH